MPKSTATPLVALIAVGLTAYFLYAAGELIKIAAEDAYRAPEISVDPVALRVHKMSLDEKIGQMLIVGFEHPYLDGHIRTMIERYHIGGINLLARNVRDGAQIKALAAELQAISAIPLFIATDQEGGDVVRFKFLDERTPQRAIGTPAEAAAVAEARAQELRALGVTMNFSPVLDYVSDKTSYLYRRTFAADPEKIAELGAAMIRGYCRGGIVPVAKHFPGYGNLARDPHTSDAAIEFDAAEFERGLVPFRAAVAASPDGAIMTAHIVLPGLDKKPATRSFLILDELLRNRLAFRGVIITDDMEMASAGDATAEASVEAVRAGADMIISTYTPSKQIAIFNRLKAAALGGEIPVGRINESAARILRLKSALIAGKTEEVCPPER